MREAKDERKWARCRVGCELRGNDRGRGEEAERPDRLLQYGPMDGCAAQKQGDLLK